MIWGRRRARKGKKGPSFLTHHCEAVSGCNLPCGFSGAGGERESEKLPLAFCVQGDCFTAIIEIIQGQPHIKTHFIPPSPTTTTITVLGSPTPSMIYRLFCWLLLWFPKRQTHLTNKRRASGWSAGPAVGFPLLRPTPKALIINCPSEMRKVQRQCV